MGTNAGAGSRREKILRRDRYCCVYCGISYPATDLTLDHVEPRMRGGDDSEGNLVTCCRECNRLKAGAAAWSFLSRRPDLRLNFMNAVERSDTRYAAPVWNRLLRAIEEAAIGAAT